MERFAQVICYKINKPTLSYLLRIQGGGNQSRIMLVPRTNTLSLVFNCLTNRNGQGIALDAYDSKYLSLENLILYYFHAVFIISIIL